MKKKIVAFAGSNSSKSINKQLVRYVLSYYDDFDIKFLDLNDFEMPIFSVDREKNDPFPEKAIQFRNEFETADAIVCSMAEHNRTYSIAMKNILDWCSRVDLNIFHEKPMLLMSTSTGGYGGGNVMQLAKSFFPRCHADVIETFSLPSFKENFTNNTITNEELKKELETKIQTFRNRII